MKWKIILLLGIAILAVSFVRADLASDLEALAGPMPEGWDETVKDELDFTYDFKEKVYINELDGIKSEVSESGFVKLSKWDDEVYIKLEYYNPNPMSLSSSDFTDSKTLKLSTSKTEVNYYIKNVSENTRGFEYEIILKEKPLSNVISIPIETKNLNFYYQPPLYLRYGLTEPNATCNATDCEGTHRPINVVGSYAVYHSSKKDNQYMTGKAFHIYRPLIIDSNNDTIWAELNIENSIMTITIDQEWLDKAIYPVVVDPIFGYDTLEPSSWVNMRNVIRGTEYTLPEDADVYNMSIGLKCAGDFISFTDPRIRGAMYDGTDLEGQTGEWQGGAFDSYTEFIHIDFSSPVFLAADDYYLVSWAIMRGEDINIMFDDDAEGFTGGYDDSETYGEFPETWSPNGEEDRRYSIYAGYITAAPTDETPPTYSDNSTNATLAGEDTLFSLNWLDETGLATTGGYIFSFDNGTGTLVNDSWTAFSSNPDWSNVTKTVNSTVGATINWKIHANDTSNNWNNSEVFSYITTEAAPEDETPPTYSNTHQSVTNNTNVSIGQSITFGAQWTDETVLSMYVNSTSINNSAFTNGTWQAFTGGNWSNFTISYPANAEGGSFIVKIYANDTSGNINETPEWFWKNETVAPDTTPPTYSDNSTNSTYAGRDILHSLNWSDETELSGYIFQFCNGNWNGSDCERKVTTIQLQDADTENLEDAYVDEFQPNINLGSSNGLDAGGIIISPPPTELASYIMFDISQISSGANITNAIFGIYLYRTSYESVDNPVLEIWSVDNNTWSESQITWNDRPTQFQTKEDSNNTLSNTSGFWVYLNVTSWVKTEYDSSDKNVSFYLNATQTGDAENDFFEFWSKEYTADTTKRPYLNITYSEEGWTNDTFVPMTGTGNWSNVTKTITLDVGVNVSWCVHANDTSNNWNSTSCENPFSYVTTAPPDTCTCPASGNWLIQCSDNCDIQACDMQTNNVLINGTGTAQGLRNITNAKRIRIQGGCVARW